MSMIERMIRAKVVGLKSDSKVSEDKMAEMTELTAEWAVLKYEALKTAGNVGLMMDSMVNII